MGETKSKAAGAYNRATAITYDTKDHMDIIFRLHGSVWRPVIGFCIFNTLLTLAIILLKHNGIDLTFKDRGHSFMSVLVSFLVVSRNGIVYSRYMEARAYLGDLFRHSRELIQYSAILTMQDDRPGPLMREWRFKLARQTIILLEVTLGFLSFRSQGENVWDNSTMDEIDKAELRKRFNLQENIIQESVVANSSAEEINGETPIFLLYNLKKLIANHVDYNLAPHVNKEMKFYTCVDSFSTAYYGLKRLITTPFPFPLIQMGRTFLFFWVFTLPFALVNDMGEVCVADLAIIFFLTYGYVGLEFVSMEMDDPFGDDENDFNHVGMARAVIEDIYLVVYDSCGGEEASRLRQMFGEVKDDYHEEYKAGHHRKATEIDDSIVIYSAEDDSLPQAPRSSFASNGSKRVSFNSMYNYTNGGGNYAPSDSSGTEEYEDAFAV